MLEPIRRLISGLDKNKQSKILSEEQIKAFVPYDLFPCFQIQELFYTEDIPQSLETTHLNKPYDIELPQGAFRAMKLRMPTKKEMTQYLEKAGQPIPTDWTKFNLHSTNSIDYVYVISGEINYVAGSEVKKLKQGDFLAQIGPEHTWVNESDEPCHLLCMMIGTDENKERKKMIVE